MTELIDRQFGRHGVHVLIVGVEKYESEHLDSLVGVTKTAKSVAKWWLESEDGGRLLPDERLGSLAILLSGAESETMKTSSGDDVSIDRASKENVSKAIEAWLARSQNASLSVIHWIGHGESSGQSGGETQALYCDDADYVSNDQHGLNWYTCLRGIETKGSARRTWCFIDACRSESLDYDRDNLFNPIRYTRRDKLNKRATVIYSALNGVQAHCLETKSDVLDDFCSGPVFSQALLCAIDRFAAAKINLGLGFASYESEIANSIEARMIQWLRRRRPGHFDDFSVECDSIVEVQSGAQRRYPFVRIPSPQCMVSIHLSRGSRSRVNCTVSLDDGTGNETDVTESLREFSQGWDIDVARSEMSGRDCKICLANQRIFGKGKKSSEERIVAANGPYIRIDMSGS